MTKNFFIVVPYSPTLLKASSSGISELVGKVRGERQVENPEEKNMNFEERRTQIEQRIGVVESGLVRTGVRIVQLGTEEVIELFYKMFNPGELERPIPINTEITA